MNAYLKEVTDKEYEEKLNDIYGTVEICGMTFVKNKTRITQKKGVYNETN